MSEKKVYKRGFFSYIGSLTVAIVTPVFVWFIASIFTENIYILYGPSAVIFLFLIYSTIFKENIKFEIEDGEFKYFQKGKLKRELNLKEYYSGYRVKTSDGSADIIMLYLAKIGDEQEEVDIDCTALGTIKFYKMYETIKEYAKEKVEKLEAKNNL